MITWEHWTSKTSGNKAKIKQARKKKNQWRKRYMVYPKLWGSMGNSATFLHWLSAISLAGNSSQSEEGRLETNVTDLALGKSFDLHEVQLPLLWIDLPQIREPMPRTRTEYALNKCWSQISGLHYVGNHVGKRLSWIVGGDVHSRNLLRG